MLVCEICFLIVDVDGFFVKLDEVDYVEGVVFFGVYYVGYLFGVEFFEVWICVFGW